MMISYKFVKLFKIENGAVRAILFRSKEYGRDKLPRFLCRGYNNTFSEQFIDFRFNNSMLFSVKNTGSLMLLRGQRIVLKFYFDPGNKLKYSGIGCYSFPLR